MKILNVGYAIVLGMFGLVGFRCWQSVREHEFTARMGISRANGEFVELTRLAPGTVLKTTVVPGSADPADHIPTITFLEVNETDPDGNTNIVMVFPSPFGVAFKRGESIMVRTVALDDGDHVQYVRFANKKEQ